jgi:endonuclease/exonuclease/phosphatase family metal-dependent hydrolase
MILLYNKQEAISVQFNYNLMKHILHAVLFFLSSTQVLGQELFYDGFANRKTDYITDAGWEGTGNGSYSTINYYGNLSVKGITTTGACAYMVNVNRETVSKSLSGTVSDGTIYMSMIVSGGGGSTSGLNKGGSYFISLIGNDLKTPIARVFMKEENGGLKFGVSKSSDVAVYTPNYYDAVRKYILVIKYTFGSNSDTDDKVELIVNPTLNDKEPTALVRANTGEKDATQAFGRVLLRQNSLCPEISVDEIRVSKTWKEAILYDATKTAKMATITTDLIRMGGYVAKGSFETTFSIQGENLDDRYYNVSAPEGFSIRETKYFYNGRNDLLLRAGTDGTLTSQFNLRINETAKVGVINDSIRLWGAGFSDIYIKIRGTVYKEPTISDITPISEVRKKPLNSLVTLAGRLTVGKEFTTTVYIQDKTAGISIFSKELANDFFITKDDSVIVTGVLSAFNNQLQIGRNDIAFIEKNTSSNAPKPINIKITDLKNYEGQLVSISDVSFSDKNFVLIGNSNYAITDGTNNGEIRIIEGTNIVGRTKPQAKVNIIGVVGRFQDIYQLQPRFIEDLPNTDTYKRPQTNLAPDKSFKVATWNTNWLGNIANGPTNEVQQQTNFQQVIDSLKADIYVLEEVSNTKFFRDFVAKYTNYKGFCSSAISAGGVADDAQRVCFLYKKGIVDSVSARPLLTKATNLVNYPENNPARFWASGRLPFLFIADATIDGIKKRLHIVGIHARANTGGSTATLAAKELQYSQRKYDVEVLKDSLDAQFPNANIILAGDYNDDVDETVSEITSTKESSYKKYIDDSKNYQAITKTLSDNGVRSYLSQNNVIDHIIISNELTENYVQNSVSPELGFLYVANYAASTSDHLPIYASFNFEIKSPTALTAKAETYDKITLAWKDNTLNETSFEVERSLDGINFIKVGEVASNTTTFINVDLKEGTKYFYRLRTVTPEGKSKYSAIVEATTLRILALELSEGQLMISASPNPVYNLVGIKAIGDIFEFSLLNTTGLVIIENTGKLEFVNQSINSKLPSLPAGIYLLKMSSGDKYGILKMLKQ